MHKRNASGRTQNNTTRFENKLLDEHIDNLHSHSREQWDAEVVIPIKRQHFGYSGREWSHGGEQRQVDDDGGIGEKWGNVESKEEARKKEASSADERFTAAQTRTVT